MTFTIIKLFCKDRESFCNLQSEPLKVRLLFLYYCDFFVRQTIELIDETVDFGFYSGLPSSIFSLRW